MPLEKFNEDVTSLSMEGMVEKQRPIKTMINDEVQEGKLHPTPLIQKILQLE